VLIVSTAAGAENDGAGPVRFRESVSLETSRQAARQLDAVALHARDGRWGEAVEELERVRASEGKSLVAYSVGRYLNAGRYCNLIAAGWPAEGLAAYRRTVDSRAAAWFAAGRDARDERELQRVVREAFASSVGDDALLLLGEWAWERGDAVTARRYWQQMLPPTSPAADGAQPLALRYPDTNHDHAEILARLILCSLLEHDFERAALEREAFDRLHPQAQGELAGRTGRLSDILRDLGAEAERWEGARPDEEMHTFAVNARRNGVLPRSAEVGSLLWSAPLPAGSLALREEVSPGAALDRVSHFPVVYRDIVLVNDADRILAYRASTGRPAWPGDDADSAAIYSAFPGDGPPAPFVASVGVPRYTLTVHDGRLYARMGSPITGRSSRELRELTGHLVCLDLEHGQGKLVWKVEKVDDDAAWAFEGTPVAAEGRLYVALRRGFPETQSNVACLDAATGRFLWNQRICAAVTDVAESQNLISHQLLALDGNLLVSSTDMGAIAGLDADTGALRWVVTYESTRASSAGEEGLAKRQSLTPCLLHEGLVVAAPADFDGLIALDADTGAERWRCALPGGVRHLMGVRSRRLVVAGDTLWGLDLYTGRVAWHVGIDDPETHGYGQGFLAGELVYWPTREEIVIVDHSSGRVRGRVALSALHGAGGGNLALSGVGLIVAGSDRLVQFSEYGGLRPRSAPAETTAWRSR